MIQSKLNKFIVDPKYRVWRHVLFILFISLIVVRRTLIIYEQGKEIVGSYIYIICLIACVIYMLLIYINIYFLVPYFLLNKRYKMYLINLFVLTLFLVIYFVVSEYVVNSIFHLPQWEAHLYFIIAQLPFFVINFICIIGTSAFAIFKKRIEENLRVDRMEQGHIKSELDRLKEQISPSFLSNILNEASVVAETDSQRASNMLMKLSQLLRYQLYDCNRDKVLFSSEINFLRGYMDLEHLRCNRFKYKLETDDITKNLLIPPLLFIPFIQYYMKNEETRNKATFLQLRFKAEGDNLIFVCWINHRKLESANELFAIKRRLNLIFENRYSLSVKEHEAIFQLNGVL